MIQWNRCLLLNSWSLTNGRVSRQGLWVLCMFQRKMLVVRQILVLCHVLRLPPSFQSRKKAAGTRITALKIHSNFRNFRSSIILTLVELLSQWEISFGRVKGKESKRVFSMCPPRQRWCLTRPCRLDNPSGWLDTDDGQNPETLSSRAPNHSMTLAWTIAAKIRMEQRTGEQPNDYNDLKSLLSRSS